MEPAPETPVTEWGEHHTRKLIEVVQENRDDVVLDLSSQGFHLPAQASLVPIFGHRYLVCMQKLNTSVVLSVVVHEVDTLVFGNSLREYLTKEFFGSHPEISDSTPARTDVRSCAVVPSREF